MKCKIFIGTWYEAQDAFNQWAKGKALTRDVLIHEQLYTHSAGTEAPYLMIIVYHPEDPHWDKTETPPKPPAHKTDEEISRLEREATGP